MDTLEKLQILADSAKYDASCSSSGSTRANKKQWNRKWKQKQEYVNSWGAERTMYIITKNTI